MSSFNQVRISLYFFQLYDDSSNNSIIFSFSQTQQLKDIIESVQVGNSLSRRDNNFLQAHIEEIKCMFLEGMVLVLRSIHTNTMMPGGIHHGHYNIQDLQLSLSLDEEKLAHLEAKWNHLMKELEDTMNLIEVVLHWGLLLRCLFTCWPVGCAPMTGPDEN